MCYIFILIIFICIYLVLPSLTFNPTRVASFCNSLNISLRAFRDLARRATFVFPYTHVYQHLCFHTHTYINICVSIHTRISTFVFPYTHVYQHLCFHTYTYINICVSIHTRISTFVFPYTHVYQHLCFHTHTLYQHFLHIQFHFAN